MTGNSKSTVLKLLADIGKVCAAYHDEHVRNVVAKRVQCDEIWSFCYGKEANAGIEVDFEWSDPYGLISVNRN